MRGLSNPRLGWSFGPRALICASLLASTATAFADDDRSADIEVFRDNVVGLWRFTSSPASWMVVSNIKWSDETSLRVSLTNAVSNPWFRLVHNWGGTMVNDCSALEFWVTGGTKNILPYVAVRVARGNNTVSQNFPLTNYVADRRGSWYRIRIPVDVLGLAGAHAVKYVEFARLGTTSLTMWLDDISFKRSSPPGPAIINVHPDSPVTPVRSAMYGIGCFTWDESLPKDSTIEALRDGGIRLLTFPGGTTANRYIWQTNSEHGTGHIGAVDTRKFVDICRKIGADGMISVNYGSATPQDAADWLYYTNVQLGYPIKHWTIGNENYGAWSYDLHPFRHDALTYAEFVAQCVTLMKAIDPNIKIGVSGTLSEFDYPQRVSVMNPRTGIMRNGWAPVMLTRLRELNVQIDYYDCHYYPVGPGNESDAFLLQSAGVWSQFQSVMRQMLRDYSQDSTDRIEIHIGETNSIFWAPGKQTTSLVNGLFLAESWGKAMMTGIYGFNWWNLHNAAETTGSMSPTLFGWRMIGDYGILARGRPDGVSPPLNTKYPTFYAMKLINLFAKPGDQLIPVTSSNLLLSAYGVKTPAGKIRLLVINKSGLKNISATFGLAALNEEPVVRRWKFGVDEDAQQKDITADIVTGSDGLWTFEPYSMTVLEFGR